jgi:hypothetical protein
MNISVADEQLAIRETHLARETKLFAATKFGKFSKIKDWDENGPAVIWEGTIEDESLKHKYKILIYYGKNYPYRRPTILPIEPKITNQRHQLPNHDDPTRPGYLCIMPFTPDYWRVGMTCEDVLERVVKWFRGYESGTLGEEFAPPEIEIYFPRSHRNCDLEVLAVDSLIVTGDEAWGTCMMYPTKPNNFAFLVTLNDSQPFDKQYEEVKRLKKLILPDEELASNKFLGGRWFKLKCEPNLPVPLNSAELADLLVKNEFDQKLIFTLFKRKPSIVGLWYPTTVPEESHWLLFKTDFVSPLGEGLPVKSYKIKFDRLNEKKPLSLYSVAHVNAQTIFRRISGYEVESLLKKKCLLLGAGSIGSTVGKELIKAGLGNLTIVDKDTLKAGNLCRHELGINYLGKFKADSLQLELLRKNPFARIETLLYDPLSKPDEFTKHVEEADIVVSCFANDSTEAFVNSVCRRLKKPVLYCRAFLEGRLGEIFFAGGEKYEACFECAADFLSEPSCSIPRPPAFTYAEEVNFDGDCGAAFLPASSGDLGIISLNCVRLVLKFLQNKLQNQNYWLIRGREFEDSEYGSLTGEIREPFRVHHYMIPANENCRL